MKTLKKLLQTKWAFIITLSLVTAIILMLTLNVAFKSGRLNAAKENLRQVARVQLLAEKTSHIQQVKQETAAATIETVVEVAAAAPQAEAVLETAVLTAEPLAAEETADAPEDAAVLTEEEFFFTEEMILQSEVVMAAADVYAEPVYEEPVYEEPAEEEPVYEVADASEDYYTSGELQVYGEIYSGGWRWTWYSQNVLPGGGLSIPGRHVDENGYICDENDRICLASEDLEYGTVVSTPFGKEGCVYDCGCDYGTLDVYVDF